MTKYIEALKEYNRGKDKWCMPRKGSDDYKLIIKIIEKNNGTKLSTKEPKVPKVKVQKEPKVKVPKEPNVKVPKEPKVKDPKNKSIINLPILNNRFSNKKYSKSLKKSSEKRSSVFIKHVDNKQNVNIIANFLKNKLIKDKYTLDNRVAFYKYISNILSDINGDECLEPKLFDGKKGYTINNKINLYKKIGSASVYGVIYLTSIVNSFGGFTIASKVMPKTRDNTNEIQIMKNITDEIILKKRSRHFALMYKHCYM